MTSRYDRVSFHKIIPTLPIGCETEKYSAQGFDWLYCPIESFQIKAVLFPPFAHHIPAAAQRGCSDALISHTGQRRGQHTRTSLPVSSPCLQPLLYTALLLIPLLGILQIPSLCLSGSRSAAFPDPENRRNGGRERRYWSHSPRAWIQD